MYSMLQELACVSIPCRKVTLASETISYPEGKFLGRIDSASTAARSGKHTCRSAGFPKGIRSTNLNSCSVLILARVVWDSDGLRRHGIIACLLQILWLAGMRLRCPGAIRYNDLLDPKRAYWYCLALATKSPRTPMLLCMRLSAPRLTHPRT